jgi:plasmid segregation protein ParM
MKLFIDEGTTHVKMGWVDADGVMHFQVTPNGIISGHMPESGMPQANYTIKGQQYAFSPVSAGTLPTTHVSFQYSDLNVLAVHHAMHESGIEPQEVDIVVTLPLSEYYNSDNARNQFNIDRKTKIYAEAVDKMKAKPFTIKNVEVRPEAIPAGLLCINTLQDGDSLLIIDIGGTTVDIAQVAWDMSSVYRMSCLSELGAKSIVQALKNDLMLHGESVSDVRLHTIIKRRTESEWLENIMNKPESAKTIESVIDKAAADLMNKISSAIAHYSGYSHVAIVGGGADPVSPHAAAALGIRKERIFISDEPQLELVKGLIHLG